MAAAASTDHQHPPALHLDAEVIESLDKADAVEQRPFQPAIGEAAHRVHRAGHAGHRVARVEEVEQRTLVRDGGPEPADVFGLQPVFEKSAQRHRGQFQRHQHGVDAVALEQRVVDLGCAHLRNRIAEDVEDAGGAGKVHTGSCLGGRREEWNTRKISTSATHWIRHHVAGFRNDKFAGSRHAAGAPDARLVLQQHRDRLQDALYDKPRCCRIIGGDAGGLVVQAAQSLSQPPNCHEPGRSP